MIDRHKTNPPYAMICDAPGCSAQYDGEPWANRPSVRAAGRRAGWRSITTKHNHSTGGYGVRRIDDLCPDHAHLEATWAPKRMR